MSFCVSEKPGGGTFQLTEGEVWGRLRAQISLVLASYL